MTQKQFIIGDWTIIILALGIVGITIFLPWNMPTRIIISFLFCIIIICIDVLKHKQKMSKAIEVYKFGNEVQIYLEEIFNNYGYRINGMPQKIIQIRKDNELLKVKTFSDRVIRAFTIPVQTAFIHNKYPNIILPSSIFSKNYYNPNQSFKKQKSRSINI